MSLPHALLTALIERPGAGSELTKRFDRSIGFFWSATHQQIYKELHRLEASGLIEAQSPENGRGRKKAYRVLPAGAEELKRWLRDARDPKPSRDELMVCLRAEAAVGPTNLKSVIAQRLRKHRERLALYRHIEQRDFAKTSETREQALQHLILTAGVKSEKTWIEVLEQALRILDMDEA